VRFERLCSVENQQALLQLPVSWIAFIGVVVAEDWRCRAELPIALDHVVVEFTGQSTDKTLSPVSLHGMIRRVVIVPMKLHPSRNVD